MIAAEKTYTVRKMGIEHEGITFGIKKDGLAHNSVLSITLDGDRVWFGTSRGLSRYNKSTGSWTTFTQFYGPEDL